MKISFQTLQSCLLYPKIDFKRSYKIIIFLFLLLSYNNKSIAQNQPYLYYTFENANNYNNWTNSSNNTIIGQCTTTCTLLPGGTDPTFPSGGQVGNFAAFGSATSIFPFNGQATFNSNSGFAIEMLVKFDKEFSGNRLGRLMSLTDGSGTIVAEIFINIDLVVLNNGGSPVGLTFSTDFIDIPSGPSKDIQYVEFDGIDRKSLNYYLDEDWHHFVFMFDVANKKKKIWIDGYCPAEFEQAVSGTTISLPASSLKVILGESTSYDKLIGGIDELALYSSLPSSGSDVDDKFFYEHYENAIEDGLHYKFDLNANAGPASPPDLNADVDINEFPDGHTIGDGNSSSSDVTQAPLQQLNGFSLPRFKPGHTLSPNVNWVRTKIMASGTHAGNPSADEIDTSLNMQITLASYWNYYFNLSENVSREVGTFLDNDEHAGYWLEYVKDAGNLPTTSKFKYNIITNRNQVTLADYDAGEWDNGYNGSSLKYQHFNDDGLGTQLNPDDVYLVYSTGPPVIYLDKVGNQVSSPKLWSPHADYHKYEDDANTTLLYIDPLLDELESNTPFHINFISENNEAAHAPYIDKIDLIDTDEIPEAFETALHVIAACSTYVGTTCTTKTQWDDYEGSRKVAVDKLAWMDVMLTDTRLLSANILNYGVDGGPVDRYVWEHLRQTQRFDVSGNNGLLKTPYPTPDYYPIKPSKWKIQTSSLNVDGTDQLTRGWRWMARSKTAELPEGDKLSAPFMGAGWFINEELNIRPAQWLGLCKAVGVLGSEFFHSYYDVSNGAAKGYVWQAAPPSYAQAVLSRAETILRNGNILEGDVLANPSAPGNGPGYMFNTGNPLHLVCMRRDYDPVNALDIDRFLITGSIQRITNDADVSLSSLSTDVIIAPAIAGNPSTLQFNIRRQGSTYIFDNSGGDAAFWQLDKWHQYEHPERWTEDFVFEAEVMDNIETNNTKNPLPGVTIRTIDNTTLSVITNGNFKDFTSYVSFETPSPLEYRFQPRNDGVDNVYTFFIKARNADVTNASISGLSLTLTDLTAENTVGTWKINCVNSSDWNWYGKDECSGDVIQFTDLINDHQYMLSIVPATLKLEIDMIYLTAPNSTFAETVLSPCNSYDFDITDNTQPQSANTIFGGINVANSTIHLAEDVILEIDYTVTFENCIFTMEGNNYIVVTGTNDLSLINCGIHSCGEMWNDLRTSGASNIVCTGTTIEDALTALRLTGHDQADINNSLFCKNWNGIVASSADLISVDNTIFDYPKPHLTLPDPMVDLDPIHISGSTSNLIIENSTFRNSTLYSIFLTNWNDVVIEGCSFEGNAQAFTYDYPINGATVSIQNNKFKPAYEDNGKMNGQFGIAIWGTGSYDMELAIQNNSITDYARPILVMNITNSSNSTKIIEGNSLILTRTVAQLDLGSADYRGIKIVNSVNINLENDTIVWTNNPDDGTDYNELVQGIRLEESTDAEVSGNLIEKMGAGITIMEDCSDIKFKCNTMSKCWNGVYLDVNGASNKLTTQGVWTGSSSGSDSWNNQWLNLKNGNQYKVDGTIDPFTSLNWVYNSNAGLPFRPTPISSSLTSYIFAVACTSSIGCAAPEPIMMRNIGDSLTSEMRDSLYGDAVGDSAYFSIIDPEYLYYGKLDFYEAVIADSSILYLGVPNDSIYIAIYDSLKLTNMGLTVEARQHIDIGEFGQAITILDDITSPNTIESNMKFALETYVNFYAPIDTTHTVTINMPDSTTMTFMSDIANEHPFYNGKGVYLLRSLLHKDFESVLPQQRIQSILNDKKYLEKEVFIGTLYPNPSKGMVNYTCTSNDGEKIIFSLQNTMGSEVTMVHLQNTSNAINVHFLDPGIYFYLVSVNGKIKDKGKLIINN